MIDLSGFIITLRDTTLWSNLSPQEQTILLRYRGFNHSPLSDNDILPFDLEPKLTKNLKSILENYQNVRRATILCDLLWLTTDVKSTIQDSDFIFLGFDVGILEEHGEPIFFSGILNELRPSGNSYIRHLVQSLNANYLFSNLEDCTNFLAARDKALKHQPDFLETAYETSQYQVIAVWLYQESKVSLNSVE
jgi:hypothetical protein